MRRRWAVLLIASAVALTGSATAQAEGAADAVRRVRLLGDLSAAEEMARQALAERESTLALQVALHLELARIHDRRGLHHGTRPVAAALESVEAAAAIAPPDDERLQAAIELARAEVLYRAEMSDGEFRRATQSATRAVDRYRALQDPEGEADAVHRLGLIALQQDDLERARELFERSLDLDLVQGGRTFFRGEYERHMAFVLMFSGDTEGAIPHFRRSFEARVESNAIDAAMFAANSLASALLDVGRIDEARAPLAYATTIAERIDSPLGRTRNARVAERLAALAGEPQDPISVANPRKRA